MSIGNGASALLPMLDGTVKDCGTTRAAAPRMYSWFLTKEKQLAFTKAHVHLIRDILLNPPEPPFSVIISDSGQKNLIFRAPVAVDRFHFPVLLEDERIEVPVSALHDFVFTASRISSKMGKPVLSERGDYSINHFIMARKAGVGEELRIWEVVKSLPLARLAAWIAPPKDKAVTLI